MYLCFFFFFKQKTAYEMRISDWSSDVCSSDLVRELAEELAIDVEAACLAPACFASDTLGDKHLLLLLYVCRKWRGTPQAIHASALRWVRPVELYAQIGRAHV